METGSRVTSESLDLNAEEREQDRSRKLSSTGGVFGRLSDEGYRFHFTQLLRILELAFPAAPNFGETVNYDDVPVRLRPSADLVFPPADVKTVVAEPERIQVVTTFHGLYGIDSPLPYHFYEPLARKTRDTAPNRDFLDIFNHRLYAFFYRAWKKWRPSLHFRRDEPDHHSRRFVSLTGLGRTESVAEKSVPPMRVAALAGLLGRRNHNAEGLEALLGSFFEDFGIEVIENMPRWVPIPSQSRLGESGLELGGATIGKKVFDRSGKFRISLGPLSLERYRALLPGGSDAELVQKLVELYVPGHLEYDVELRLPSEELPTTTLGESGSQLGYTTSLGGPTEPRLSRVVNYD